MILNKKVELNLLLKKWLVNYIGVTSACEKFWLENSGKQYNLYISALYFTNKDKNEILKLYPDILNVNIVSNYPTGWDFKLYNKTDKAYKKHHLILRVNNVYEELKIVDILCYDEVLATMIFPLTPIGIKLGNKLLLDMLEDVVGSAYYIQLRRNQQIQDILS